MKKFDPIDMFFIIIISGYFITLACFIITLICTYLHRFFKNKKLTQISTNENTISSPIKTETVIPNYTAIFNNALTIKPIWKKTEFEHSKVPKSQLIMLPFTKKVRIKNNKKLIQMLKTPIISKKEPSKKPTVIIEKIKIIFAKKDKEPQFTSKAKQLFNKFFKTKNKEAKLSTPKTKPQFKLANNKLFRKLFMKEVIKEDKLEAYEIDEVKKEQLNIFDSSLNEKEEITKLIKTTEKKAGSKEQRDETIEEKLEVAKSSPVKNTSKTNKQKNQKQSHNKQNNNKKNNHNNNQKNKPNTSSKKKNNSNKKANGTTPKKKSTNNKNTTKKSKNN